MSWKRRVVIGQEEEILYESVTINLSTSFTFIPANGQTVTINDETYSLSNTTLTVEIPYGTEYTVSVNNRTGFTKPSNQTYTAGQESRTINMKYTKKNGVYGYLSSKKLKTSGTSSCTAVAIFTSSGNYLLDKYLQVSMTRANAISTAKTLTKFDKKGIIGTVADWKILINKALTINNMLTDIGGTTYPFVSGKSYYYWASDSDDSKYLYFKYEWRKQNGQSLIGEYNNSDNSAKSRAIMKLT